MTDGLLLMVAGMGTVMAFLGLMVLVMNGTAIYFKRRDARLAAKVESAAQVRSASADDESPILVKPRAGARVDVGGES